MFAEFASAVALGVVLFAIALAGACLTVFIGLNMIAGFGLSFLEVVGIAYVVAGLATAPKS